MEEERKLYPLRFRPLEDKYSWGTDEFRMADLGWRDSLVRDGWLSGNSIGEIMDMYMDRIVGEDVFSYFGRQFPIQVKYLRVNGRQALRVSPDDELASQRYDFLGREKYWYVVSAGEDARLFIGFRSETSAPDFIEACGKGNADAFLNSVRPKAGDVFVIPPGTVNAASGNVVIAEISESSPMDFRLCGHLPEEDADEFDPSLGLIEALDFIDFGKFRKTPLKSFEVNVRTLDNPLHIFSEEADSFALYSCVAGEAEVRCGGDKTPLKEGETVLVPAECNDIFLVPLSKGTVVLESLCPVRPAEDPYINKDAAPSLPDE